MTIKDAVKTCFLKYATFSGRASKAEFWYFALFLALFYTIGNTISTNMANTGDQTFSFNFGLQFGIGLEFSWFINLFSATFAVPFMAALSRRIHDVGMTGGHLFAAVFLLFALVIFGLKAMPTQQMQTYLFVGYIIIVAGLFLYSTVRKSDPKSNKYGPNPHEVPS